MRGMIILADYFEDIEAIATIDLLRRAKIQIDTVSLKNTKRLITQSNMIIETEYLYEDINIEKYDFLVIPGGKAVYTTHLDSNLTKEIIHYFEKKKLLIATICAAPAILGKLGLLDALAFTCFPGSEKYITKGLYKQNASVVVSGNIITSKAAGATFEFAAAIIEYLLNKETADQTISSIYYNK